MPSPSREPLPNNSPAPGPVDNGPIDNKEAPFKKEKISELRQQWSDSKTALVDLLQGLGLEAGAPLSENHVAQTQAKI